MWKAAMFKGKKVWAEVDEQGNPLVQQGRTPIRYSTKSGVKIYRAGSRALELLDESAVDLPEGEAIKEKKSFSSGVGSAKNRTAAQAQQARTNARDLLASFAPSAIVCFTDGSCRGNPGPAGVGVFMTMPDGQEHRRSRYLGKATNNVAELTAIEEVLNMVQRLNIPDEQKIEVLTDSKYVYGLLQLNWKAKANASLIQSIKARLRSRGNVRLHWVAGHAGIEENEQADQLANKAVDEERDS